jgi:SAM-dependent methyltransferase
MRSQFLKLMKCPYCGSGFRIQDVIEEKEDDLIFGCVRCECSEFPIVEGILILKAGPMNRLIVRFIKERRTCEASIHCFGWDDFESLYKSYISFRFSKKIQEALRRFLFVLGRAELFREHGKNYRDYSAESLSFYDVLGKSSFDMYLRNRFSTFSFWSIYPFIPLLKRKKSKILDLGCGAGHGAFVVSKYVEPQLHCCSDTSYRLLYLARKYFVQRAEFVCFDANSPLPFKDQLFDTIMMSDAFHYVYGRAYLAREMERTLLPGGLILLQHLHNSLTQNPATGGYPLTHKTYAHLFDSDKFELNVMPEKRIVESYLFGNKLDLTAKYSEDELNSTNAMILMATSDKSLFKVYDKVNRDFLSVKNNLVINPIYEMKSTDDSILLVRSSQYARAQFLYEDYYPLTKKYIPEKYEIRKEFVSVSGRKVHISDLEKAEDLMKRFIIINVPENYLK